MNITRLAVSLAASLIVLCAACAVQERETASSSNDDVAGAVVVPVAPMNMPHSSPIAARLPDGRVLVASGYGTEIYDPAANRWTTDWMLPHIQFGEGFALPDGRVVTVCGTGSSTGQSSVGIYEPQPNYPFGRWTTATQYVERQGCHATLLRDGSVLLVGGYIRSTNTYPTTNLIFDPSAGTITDVTGLKRPRRDAAVVTLADGRVLAIGGSDAGGATRWVDIYDPRDGTVTAGPDTLEKRSNPRAVLLQDGRVLVIGFGSGVFAEVFDPVTKRWTAAGPMTVPRSEPETVLLGDGRVVLLGGASIGTVGSPAGQAMAAVDVFDPSTNTFSRLPTLPLSVIQPATVLLTDGRILVAGGRVTHDSSSTTSSVWIYDVNSACVPTTCDAVGAQCGTISDGCGGTPSCGWCGTSQTCSANRCTTVPRTCASWPNTCGEVPDGMGGTLHCGTCAAGQTCLLNTCITSSSTATYDSAPGGPRGAPACAQRTMACDSGTTLIGRGPLGPEPNAPNTSDDCLDGTSGSFHVHESVDAIRVASAESDLALRANVTIEVDYFARGTFDTLDVYVWDGLTGWADVGSVGAPAPGYQTAVFAHQLPGTGGAYQIIRAVLRAGATASRCPGGIYDDVDDLVLHVSSSTLAPPDVTPPTIVITAPQEGARLAPGPLTVTADASDDQRIRNVSFYLDSTPIATRWWEFGDSLTFSVPFDARWFGDGPHVIRAEAFDHSGNRAVASIHVSTDALPPVVSLSSPVAGDWLSGVAVLTAQVSDPSGISKVEFFDGQQLIETATASPWQVSWNTTGAATGIHYLVVRATDGLGNAQSSPSVSVEVHNPAWLRAAPDASLRAPRCSQQGQLCDSGTLLDGRGPLGPEPSAPNAINGSCADGTSGTYHSGQSLDRIRVLSTDGGLLAAGKPVRVEVTAWGAASAWDRIFDRIDIWYAANAASPQWVRAGTLSPTSSGAQTLGLTYTLPPSLSQAQAVRAMYRHGGSSSSACVAGSYNDVDDLAFAVVPSVPPAAPGNLTATATSGTSVSLRWTDNSTNETAFLIERKTGPTGAYSQIASVGANAVTYTASGLTAGVTYSFRVRASNSYSTSAYSSEVTVTTAGPPPAPTSLVATPTSTTAVRLSWTDNSGSETSFLIERKTGSTGTYSQIASVGSNVVAYTVSGLTTGTSYTFRVRASNSYGASAYSNEASAVPDAVPAAPSNLVHAGGYPGQVILSWVDNSNNETEFSIESDTGFVYLTVGANVTSASIQPLSGGYTYLFRVRARNGAGYSGYSNTVSAPVAYGGQ